MNSLYSPRLCWKVVFVASVMFLGCTHVAVAADDANLTKDQMKQFLLTAKVIKSKQGGKGITSPWKLTLSDGTITHDASFQGIDEHKMNMQFASGRSEMNFTDSYKYNIAAYTLAEMLGIDDIMPVYVERKWRGDSGSISWWLPVMMDEEDRHKKGLQPPDPDAWNKQMYRVRVFNQLTYDTDSNLTNVLIGNDWKIYRVDFSRGFRPQKDLQSIKDLEKCDRQLLEKLKSLDGNDVAARTKKYLNKNEIQAVMARRDKIVEHFQKLISEKGEKDVLY